MSEVIHGNASGDQLNASKDKTQVYGLADNDTLISDRKSDALLVGGSGDDSLIMLGGNGTLSGGDGSDTFELNYSATEKISAVIEDLDPMKDKIVVNFDGNTAPKLSSVASGNDVVWTDGANFNLTLKSVRENDYFDGTASDEAWEVLKLTNDEREKENLPLLTMADGLTKGAAIRAEEIASLGAVGELDVYKHTRPNGTDFSTVFDDVGKYYSNYAENLDGGATTPEGVIKDWIGSPSHYVNIMNPGFLKIGVGDTYDDSDLYNLRWYWTQLFADSLNATETVSAAELLTANIESHTVSKFVELTEGDNTYNNTAYGATINALGGNDLITNEGLVVSISGGTGKDTIDNRASFATINAGTGDDSINLGSATKENVIQYKIGDGADTISGLNSTDTVSISGDEFTPAIVGDNVIIAVGTDSITLIDAAKNGGYINGLKSKLIILTDDDDYYRDLDDEYYSDTDEKVTIKGLGGNDTITSWSSNVSIDGGTGNDTINNSYGDNVTINSGAGDDSIYNRGANVILNGDADDDFIYNTSLASDVIINGADGNDDIHIYGTNVTVDGGAGNDYLRNYESSKISIKGGAGDDTVTIEGSFVTVEGDSGNDFVRNYGNSAIVFGGAGNDTINNFSGDNISISGGADNDTINNFSGNNISISGGAGDDYINNEGDNVTIDTGEGDDYIDSSGSNVSIIAGSASGIISLSNDAQNNLIQYTSGTGNDFIFGFNETDTLKLYLSNNNYSTQANDNNVIVYIGDYFIGLIGAATLSTINIDVENVEGNLSITNEDSNVSVIGSAGNDSIWNEGTKVTIDASAGNDSISNIGASAIIDGGDDNDSIINTGKNVTIAGGAGNDSIEIKGDNVLIEYNAGDGSDTIKGFNEDDTLQIGSGTGTYSTQQSGFDLVVNVGGESIKLEDVYNNSESVNINGEIITLELKNIVLTDGDDELEISRDSISIDALAGNDSIRNGGNFATVIGGADNDSIYNTGASATIDGGTGDDSITNAYSDSVTISGDDGNDSIDNSGSNVTIDAGKGDDSILNYFGENVVFRYREGDGNDTIWYFNEDDTLQIGDGTGTYSTQISKFSLIVNVGGGSIKLEDIYKTSESININGEKVALEPNINKYIENEEDNVLLSGGEGNDEIDNSGSNVTIDGGAGDDSISNTGNDTTIDGGDGNDTIENEVYYDEIDGDNVGADITINGGTGDDLIKLGFDAENKIGLGSLIIYKAGDGNDTIEDFNATSTLQIGTGTGTYSTQKSGGNLIVNVGNGNINLKNAYVTSDKVNINGNLIALEKNIAFSDDDDEIMIYRDSILLDAGAGNDSIDNFGASSTIDAGAGNDYIVNFADNVSINGGEGNDYIGIWGGNNITIKAGAGDDYIVNLNDSNFLFQYAQGDGNDTINRFNSMDTLSISGGEYTRSTIGNDVIFKVGTGSITLLNAATLSSVNLVANSKYVKLTEGNDTYSNSVEGATILALGGNDYIWNDTLASSVSISGGAGNDSLINNGTNITINGDAGEDSILSSGDSVTISGGDDRDYIYNSGSTVSISGDAGNDHIQNYKDGSFVTINGADGNDNVRNEGATVTVELGDGDDTIHNFETAKNVTINGGAGKDSVNNGGDSVTVNLGAGNDTILNSGSSVAIDGADDDDLIWSDVSSVSISGGKGNDSIENEGGSYVTIGGGEGNDSITNSGAFVTIAGGTGDDQISLSSDAQNVLINYTLGDGDDTIWGLTKDNAKINISGAKYFTEPSGNDVIIKVGDNSITLKNFRENPEHIIIGESGSSGGTGGGGSGSSGGNSGSGSGGSNSSGGTSSSSNSNSAASGGNSASGSSGTSSGSSGSSSSGRTRLTTTPTTTTTQQVSAAAIQNTAYTGGTQIIFDYKSGDKLYFNTEYKGAVFDGAGNFFADFSTGAIAIQNVTNKVVDLSDAAGNPCLKAYKASNAGVIDGRSLAGYQIINGSAGSDEIYAGVNGSQITGGTGNDTLIGGRGVDVFVTGRAQGSDLIRNASLLDKVNLTDLTSSDISSKSEDNGIISLSFRTGGTLRVESNDILSPTFRLSDGSYFFYNSISKSWRTVGQASENQKVYGGGEQTISSYQSGEKILFNAEYRGGSYDGEGNFRVNSSAGSLVVQNAMDKVIDLTNSAGNSIVKAYAASTSGVINGKDLTGYQIINGSAGADVICAGNGGSQLWGGAEADVLIGGDGADTFITGRTHGADLISNASTADNINLNDATLSDIVGTSESNGTISLSFNNGNVINVQSSEALSARFTLADGSAYRYNHARKTWQSA